MSSTHPPSPEQAYFDVPEITLQDAPIRIPHKFAYSRHPYQLFVHLLGLGADHIPPRWAVAIEILQGTKIVLPVSRIGSDLYEDMHAARQVGLDHALRWAENLMPVQDSFQPKS